MKDYKEFREYYTRIENRARDIVDLLTKDWRWVSFERVEFTETTINVGYDVDSTFDWFNIPLEIWDSNEAILKWNAERIAKAAEESKIAGERYNASLLERQRREYLELKKKFEPEAQK